MSLPWFPPFSPVRRILLLLAGAMLLPAAVAWGQQQAAPAQSADAAQDQSAQDVSEPSPGYAPPVEPGVEGLDRVRALPPGSFGQDPTGIPYSSVGVLQQTGADFNNVWDINGDLQNLGSAQPTKIGNSEGSFTLQGGSLGLTRSFIHPGTEPQDADIKAGPLYIKFHSLDGLVLASDNFRRTETDRKSELLVLLRLNLSVIAQLADNLQFGISGSVDYLPIQNQVGFQTSAYNSLGLLLDAVPLFASQLVYDTVIDDWPVRFADDFRVNTSSYADSTRDNFGLFREDALIQNESGGFYLRPGQTQSDSNSNQQSPYDASVVYLTNEVSALTDRLLPGQVRLTLRLDHENLWYNQSNRGLPPARDDFLALLASERPNERFKPYVSYNATYVEGYPGVTQSVRAGVFGPIDDQLFLRAEAGYYLDANHHDGVLYELSLQHLAGPSTTEELVLGRDLSYFDDLEVTAEYYQLQQTLGPTLNATFFVEHSTTQDLVSGSSSFSNEIGGIQLTWTMGPKTRLTLAGIAQHESYDNGGRTNTVTGRLILNRIVTDSLTLQLLYQYQRNTSNQPGNSYFENLVFIRVVKFLD